MMGTSFGPPILSVETLCVRRNIFFWFRMERIHWHKKVLIFWRLCECLVTWISLYYNCDNNLQKWVQIFIVLQELGSNYPSRLISHHTLSFPLYSSSLFLSSVCKTDLCEKLWKNADAQAPCSNWIRCTGWQCPGIANFQSSWGDCHVQPV